MQEWKSEWKREAEREKRRQERDAAEDEAREARIAAEKRKRYFQSLGRRGGVKSGQVRRQRAKERGLGADWRLRAVPIRFREGDLAALRVVSQKTGAPLASLVREAVGDYLASLGWDPMLARWKRPFRPGEGRG